MTTTDDARARAAATYDAAADRYDDLANSFWEKFGHRTIERLQLRPGARVLDVCCGNGASALSATKRVGHPIPTPEAWWSAVIGSGYRGTVEHLDANARERVQQANLDYVRRSGVRSVEANVVYAIAVK